MVEVGRSERRPARLDVGEAVGERDQPAVDPDRTADDVGTLRGELEHDVAPPRLPDRDGMLEPGVCDDAGEVVDDAVEAQLVAAGGASVRAQVHRDAAVAGRGERSADAVPQERVRRESVDEEEGRRIVGAARRKVLTDAQLDAVADAHVRVLGSVHTASSAAERRR
jgi:hypothetical protein